MDNVTTAKTVKEAGLKSLAEVSEMTGQSRQLLDAWHKERPALFKIVLLGCLSLREAHNALTEQNKALIEALEHIKRHQEIMAGEDKMILSTLSVYNIAVKALEQSK